MYGKMFYDTNLLKDPSLWDGKLKKIIIKYNTV